jgi:hypothetical protein
MYSSDNIPLCRSSAPLSLDDLNHVFLHLTGNEEITLDAMKKLVKDNPNADVCDGVDMFKTLITLPPEAMFVSVDSLDQAGLISRITNLHANEMVKYSDKYGDKDGYCGYNDFLNITKWAGLW